MGNSNSFDYRFTKSGLHNLSFTVNTKYGCKEITTKNIIIHSLPVPKASPDTIVCIGSNIQLHASDGLMYTWSPAADLQNANTSDPIASLKQNSIYYVTVTNSFGCVQHNSTITRVDKKVNLQHSNDFVLCKGESKKLTASGNSQNFFWSPSMGLSNAAIANPDASPPHTTIDLVIGYSANVCPNDTGYVKIKVGDIPRVNLGPDITVDAGSIINLNAVISGDAVNYFWSPQEGLSCSNCFSPKLIADKDMTYKLIVKTQYGCKASDEVNLKVRCGKGAVYIPNAFTPNGDGKNDVFYVMGYGIQKVKSFWIFNRWGNKFSFVKI